MLGFRLETLLGYEDDDVGSLLQAKNLRAHSKVGHSRTPCLEVHGTYEPIITERIIHL